MIDVVSFYRFVDVENPSALQASLEAHLQRLDLLGTVLIAPEGVNGTLAGTDRSLREVLAWLAAELALTTELGGRWTRAESAPFRRLRVRLKRELVALGRPDIRPQDGTGRRVAPDDWHALLDDPRTLLIDTRNRYEVEVGRFPQALDPQTDSFREFAQFAAALAADERADDSLLERPIAMYCTGGIRCEKAAALMHELGFQDVNQLEGGILNYLETVEPPASRWEGDCFVFDTRVAVDRDLAEGGYAQCHACRRPLTAADLAAPEYREGVSCPRCIDTVAPERLDRLEERRRQVRLARERGEEHIGPPRAGRGS